MAKGKDTGPGKVKVDFGDADPLNPWPNFTMELHNFNFDGDELKTEHKEALDKRLVPKLIADRSTTLSLYGYASKKGDAGYNRELSKRRMAAVRVYLIQKGVRDNQLPFDEMKARGEDDSTSKIEDDELDRSVKIKVIPPRRPKVTGGVVKRPDPAPVVKRPDPPIWVDTSWLVFGDPSSKISVPRREVYIERVTFVGETGEFKADKESDGWRIIPSLTLMAMVDQPYRYDLERYRSKQFFINTVEFFSRQRVEFNALSVHYIYDPASEPAAAIMWRLPDNRDICEGCYHGGRPQALPLK